MSNKFLYIFIVGFLFSSAGWSKTCRIDASNFYIGKTQDRAGIELEILKDGIRLEYFSMENHEGRLFGIDSDDVIPASYRKVGDTLVVDFKLPSLFRAKGEDDETQIDADINLELDLLTPTFKREWTPKFRGQTVLGSLLESLKLHDYDPDPIGEPTPLLEYDLGYDETKPQINGYVETPQLPDDNIVLSVRYSDGCSEVKATN